MCFINNSEQNMLLHTMRLNQVLCVMCTINMAKTHSSAVEETVTNIVNMMKSHERKKNVCKEEFIFMFILNHVKAISFFSFIHI